MHRQLVQTCIREHSSRPVAEFESAEFTSRSDPDLAYRRWTVVTLFVSGATAASLFAVSTGAIHNLTGAAALLAPWLSHRVLT